MAVVTENHMVIICDFSDWPLCPTRNHDHEEKGVSASGAQALAGWQKAALLVSSISYSRVDTKGQGLLCHEHSPWPVWGMFPAALEIFCKYLKGCDQSEPIWGCVYLSISGAWHRCSWPPQWAAKLVRVCLNVLGLCTYNCMSAAADSTAKLFKGSLFKAG